MNGGGGIGDALMQPQLMVSSSSLPMVASTFVVPEQAPAANKTRGAGLPPTPPPPTQVMAFAAQRGDVCMEDSAAPPRNKAHHHRRSSSDVPFGYQLLPPLKAEAAWGAHHVSGGAGAGAGDDLFNAYLNLEGLEGINSHDEGDNSRGSSIKTSGADSSENESEECADDTRGGSAGGGGIRFWGADAGVKRSATGEPLGRHARSLSMDSLMGKYNFASAAANGGGGLGPNRFSLEFGSGEFTPNEMRKIMADDKLAELALADPKRVKRVLANRQSAARSKERKMKYIAELEQKVQILQSEATNLSAQLTMMQRDSVGIATQNNELKFRLQAMDQQAQLRDALNEALTAEVQRLKLATAHLGDSCSSSSIAQQIQLNAQNRMFQLQQQQQATQIPFYQLQQSQQNGAAKNNESKE
uniref:BZIP domain-containing protein n=1 Tax=Leersia perrieri TaxID=77586 RepID=A0A0D9VP06_9ORYZ